MEITANVSENFSGKARILRMGALRKEAPWVGGGGEGVELIIEKNGESQTSRYTKKRENKSDKKRDLPGPLGQGGSLGHRSCFCRKLNALPVASSQDTRPSLVCKRKRQEINIEGGKRWIHPKIKRREKRLPSDRHNKMDIDHTQEFTGEEHSGTPVIIK